MEKYTKEECLEEIENCGTLDNIDLSELDIRAVDFKGISLKRANFLSVWLLAPQDLPVNPKIALRPSRRVATSP